MSITMLVPKQFVVTKSSAPAIDRSTWLSAAKCTTASTPAHRVLERAGVADVALHERVARVVVDVLERGQVAGVGERVVHDDLVVGVGEDVAHVVGADEPGAAGDELLHGRSSAASANGGASRSLAEIWTRSSRIDRQRPVDAERRVERAAGHAGHARRPLLVEAVEVLRHAGREWPGSRCPRRAARAPASPGHERGRDDRRRACADVGRRST